MSGRICITIRSPAVDRGIVLGGLVPRERRDEILKRILAGELSLGEWKVEGRGADAAMKKTIRLTARVRGEEEVFDLPLVLRPVEGRYRIGVPAVERERTSYDSSFEGERREVEELDVAAVEKACRVEEFLLACDMMRLWQGDRAVVRLDIDSFQDDRITLTLAPGRDARERQRILYTYDEVRHG